MSTRTGTGTDTDKGMGTGMEMGMGAGMRVEGGMDARIEASLRGAFSPARLEVINESHLHAGHAGHDGTGESHYRVRIRAAAFEGMSRLAMHRAVNRALATELATVHALAIDAGPPEPIAT